MRNILTLAALATTLTATAQWSIVAGPNLATFNRDLSRKHSGIGAGILYTAGDFHLAALYLQSGQQSPTDAKGDNSAFRLDYVQLRPSITVLHMGDLSLNAGGYIGHSLDWAFNQSWYLGSYRWLTSHWDQIASRWDYGLTLGGRWDLGPCALSATVSHGLPALGKWGPLEYAHNDGVFVGFEVPLTRKHSK